MAVDVCVECGAAIYQNTHPRRTIKLWAHKVTGSRYCDLTETTTATPSHQRAAQ